VKDPAVDALLDKVVAAQTRPQLVAALKALDRVLRHGHYAVPHWYGSVHRVSWRSGRFEQPEVTPRYYQPENWVTSTWWASTANLVGHE
jgi:microcin C transport system substrate-binding protein